MISGEVDMDFTRRGFISSLTAFGIAGCSRTPAPPFPELEAAGRPGDLGMAQGRAFAGRIQANLAFYLAWMSEGGQFPATELLARARAFEPVLAEYLPDILEEIDGIARGAGMARDEILLINARTDLRAMISAEVESEAVPACTALALTGEVDGRPSLALAQNWDWDPKLADAPVVLRMQPDRGPAFVTLVEAGMAGKIGFNHHRLGVCLNFLSHSSDARPGEVGVPIHCLLRAAMSCSDLSEVEALIRSVPRSASANFLLAQHGPDGPRAIDLEIAPIGVAALTGPSVDLIHTNHFHDPDLVLGCTSVGGPSTMTRQATAERLAAELATVRDPVRRAERILESRAELPYPISRHHNPDPDSSTLAGIVMDLTRNRFILARGAPHHSVWVDRPGV
jgi:isopenicillin-N N-acyltransferase-like protein